MFTTLLRYCLLRYCLLRYCLLHYCLLRYCLLHFMIHLMSQCYNELIKIVFGIVHEHHNF